MDLKVSSLGSRRDSMILTHRSLLEAEPGTTTDIGYSVDRLSFFFFGLRTRETRHSSPSLILGTIMSATGSSDALQSREKAWTAFVDPSVRTLASPCRRARAVHSERKSRNLHFHRRSVNVLRARRESNDQDTISIVDLTDDCCLEHRFKDVSRVLILLAHLANVLALHDVHDVLV